MPTSNTKRSNGKSGSACVKEANISSGSCKSNNCSNNTISNMPANANKQNFKARKRKRNEDIAYNELETELVDCPLKDKATIENKLQKVAKKNALTDEETRELLQRYVKDAQVLACFTLKGDSDEQPNQKKGEGEQHAILITETPSVVKLTRSKARELNKSPGFVLPSLKESTAPELAALIKDDLHSDDEDEEYTFKEEDFVSDDDHNTTASDLDSSPCTPCTPLSQVEECEESPVKFTEDGCFKIPLEKQRKDEDMRISMRTRSKLCLQQTTIEDIQSEFVPPDVEHADVQDTNFVMDEEWMKFLNDISKPLNNNTTGDDDDPVNDPEYVASDPHLDETEDYNVNVSRKELMDLMSELFDTFKPESLLLDLDLDTPDKLTNDNVSNHGLDTREQAIRRIDFTGSDDVCISDATITSTQWHQPDYSFQPMIMSTPSTNVGAMQRQIEDVAFVPVATAVDEQNLNDTTVIVEGAELRTDPDLIAVPVKGHPNRYHLAKVMPLDEGDGEEEIYSDASLQALQKRDKDIVPYDKNFTWEYISIKKCIYSEYIEKFERLKHVKRSKPGEAHRYSLQRKGFTKEQHDIFQQQLRIHVQMLTQTFLQTYCHPYHWKLGHKAKVMLTELKEKAAEKASYNAWNLHQAVELVENWEQRCSENTPENQEMMNFINKEIDYTNRNARQIPRFYPCIMDIMLSSTVFMYPQYLPRIPFTPKSCPFHVFAPSESVLIALGLDRHMTQIEKSKERLNKKKDPLLLACERLTRDLICNKTSRRVWDHIKTLRKADYYNPVKYYFEHKCAPPMEHQLIGFWNNTVLPPRELKEQLPNAWRSYIENKYYVKYRHKDKQVAAYSPQQVIHSLVNYAKEVVGEDIPLPGDLATATDPNDTSLDSVGVQTQSNQKRPFKRKRNGLKREVTPPAIAPVLNINYFCGPISFPLSYAALNDSTTLESSVSTINGQYNYNFVSSQATDVLQNLGSSETAVTTQPLILEELRDEIANETTKELDARLKGLTPETRSTQPRAPRKSVGIYLARRKSKLLSTLCKGKHKRRRSRRGLVYISLPKSRSKRKIRHIRKAKKEQDLKNHCGELLEAYESHLQAQRGVYTQKSLLIQKYYNYFKALELYSGLLIELKMFVASQQGPGGNAGSGSGGGGLAKKEEIAGATTAPPKDKKSMRQEEQLRNMLLPDTPEDANRKDAIYAYNFYEKVEEVLKNSQQPEKIKIFNDILKQFNPKTDKAPQLYKKMEQLFLPEHPELAHVFLSFLLPAEAAEIGKFFEHFMINNMTTFINKLNIYFSKQPAQVRKIYACLNELAEDPDVTVKKVETKILPLLKGNQFLIEWFMQQFPEQPPPERLLPVAESLNLKEVQAASTSKGCGEHIEYVGELPDSPTVAEQQQGQNGCQLRYINGRIFYGTRIPLPAKLTFVAANACEQSKFGLKENTAPQQPPQAAGDCVHVIRELGEKRLAHSHTHGGNANNEAEGTEKSEEDELVIDTDREDEELVLQACDEASLRAHAMRLNPGYYNHSSNADGSTCAGSFGSASLCNGSRDKRKSPTKKTKSPLIASSMRIPRQAHSQQPMVVIHEQASGAIACAKRLKTLIQEEDREGVDSKQRISIVARTKSSIQQQQQLVKSEDYDANLVTKQEVEDEQYDLEASKPLEQSTIPTSTSASDVAHTWTREDDKILLIEMQSDLTNPDELLQRIKRKLPDKSLDEIRSRQKFLIDFLCKMQSK